MTQPSCRLQGSRHRFLVRGLALISALVILSFSAWLALTQKQSESSVTELFSALPLPRVSVTEPLTSSQLLSQADAAFAAGGLRRAADQYRAAWESKADERAARKLFSVLLLREEYAEAESLLEALERARIPRSVLTILHGLLELHRGDLEKALASFSSLENHPEGIYGRALTALTVGDHEEASRLFAAVVSRSDDPLLKEGARRLHDAYEEFRLFQDGRPAHLLTLLGRALAQNQEYRLAFRLLEEAVGAQPQYRDAWVILGYCALALEEHAQAERAFETALRIDPVKPEVQELLAMTYAAQGDLERAYIQMRFALVNKVQPELPARLRFVDYAVRLGRFEEALEQYEIIFTLPGVEVRHVEEAVSLAINELRKPARARGIVDRALSVVGETPRILSLMGWVALSEDRLGEAKTLLEKAVSEDSLLAGAWYRLGITEERLGNSASALGAYRQAYDTGLEHDDIRSASLAVERYNALITSP